MICIGALVSAPTLGASAANAPSIESFYAGKTLRIVVGSPAGGSYDLSARLVAKYIPDYIPGHPDVIIQNTPGAGSVVAANQVYNSLPQDGTVMGAPERSLVVNDILAQDTNISYDSSKLNWIGSLTEDASALLVLTRSGVRSFDDLKQAFGGKELTVGSTGGGDFYPQFLIQALGAKFRVVRGYSGVSGLLLAMDRGEVDGGLLSVEAFINHYPKELKTGAAKFIYKAGFSKDPDYPDIPLLVDFVKKENLQPGYDLNDMMDLLKIRMSDGPMGRSFMMGPKVPADRVEAVRHAFDAMVKNPKFREEAAVAGFRINVKSGKDLQAMVTQLKTIPKERVNYLSKLINYIP
jgi:tripartite-type tricarboxylate transporter receptor subunit TctC